MSRRDTPRRVRGRGASEPNNRLPLGPWPQGERALKAYTEGMRKMTGLSASFAAAVPLAGGAPAGAEKLRYSGMMRNDATEQDRTPERALEILDQKRQYWGFKQFFLRRHLDELGQRLLEAQRRRYEGRVWGKKSGDDGEEPALLK